MKSLFIPVLMAATSVSAVAQEGPLKIEAVLINEDGATTRAWIINSTKIAIRYHANPTTTETKDLRLTEIASIYLLEPRDFTLAMDLYQGRKYKEAMAKFVEVKNRYKAVEALQGNHSTLSAFYEMECLRKLGDLEGLSAALGTFKKDALTREHHLRQLELYVLWDSVRSKSWQGLEGLAQERLAGKLPDYQRAQVAYCYGLALEGLERPAEALSAYQIAITADAGSSEEIVRLASIQVMKILQADPEVEAAAKAWGTPAERQNSPGYARLLEASAVARLYESSLGASMPLPDEFKDLLKYEAKPAEQPQAEPEKAEEKAEPAEG